MYDCLVGYNWTSQRFAANWMALLRPVPGFLISNHVSFDERDTYRTYILCACKKCISCGIVNSDDEQSCRL